MTAQLALLVAVLAANVLVWAPIVVDLADEFRYHRHHNPVPSRRRQRAARRAAVAMRTRVGVHPEHPAQVTGSPTRPRVDGVRRDMPTAGTSPETVPVVGAHGHAA